MLDKLTKEDYLIWQKNKNSIKNSVILLNLSLMRRTKQFKWIPISFWLSFFLIGIAYIGHKWGSNEMLIFAFIGEIFLFAIGFIVMPIIIVVESQDLVIKKKEYLKFLKRLQPEAIEFISRALQNQFSGQISFNDIKKNIELTEQHLKILISADEEYLEVEDMSKISKKALLEKENQILNNLTTIKKEVSSKIL